MAISIEPVPEGAACVWCWREITSDQPSLELKKGAHAHLACDSRMLEFIEGLGDYVAGLD